jgi:fibronectin type 3 domain-containing protein
VALQEQNPTGQAAYAVETLNEDKRSAGLSNQVQVPLAPVLAAPNDVRARVTAEGVVLTWTGFLHEHEAPELRHVYRIYRRQEGSDKNETAGDISLSTSQQARFVDHSFEWQKTYAYWVTAVTVFPRDGQESEVEGDDCPPIRVFANDIFPPIIPTGLQAVFSGVGQQPFIDLTWAPGTEADLAGYNVYRREEGGQRTKINTDLVKTPASRDSSAQSGKKYFYCVSAVDLRGNESGCSEEASEETL